MDKHIDIIKAVVSQNELASITEAIVRNKIDDRLKKLSMEKLLLVNTYITSINPPSEIQFGGYTQKYQPLNTPWEQMPN
jgi:hypothetical protein